MPSFDFSTQCKAKTRVSGDARPGNNAKFDKTFAVRRIGH
jgi:hypothetical protein